MLVWYLLWAACCSMRPANMNLFLVHCHCPHFLEEKAETAVRRCAQGHPASVRQSGHLNSGRRSVCPQPLRQTSRLALETRAVRQRRIALISATLFKPRLILPLLPASQPGRLRSAGPLAPVTMAVTRARVGKAWAQSWAQYTQCPFLPRPHGLSFHHWHTVTRLSKHTV